MKRKPEKRTVTIEINERRWRGLEFEADLLNQVFNQNFTPMQVLESRVRCPVSTAGIPPRGRR